MTQIDPKATRDSGRPYSPAEEIGARALYAYEQADHHQGLAGIEQDDDDETWDSDMEIVRQGYLLTSRVVLGAAQAEILEEAALCVDEIAADFREVVAELRANR